MLLDYNKVIMVIVSQLGTGLESYDYFSVVVTGFILVRKMVISLFCSVVETKIVKIRISNRQRYIGRSI